MEMGTTFCVARMVYIRKFYFDSISCFKLRRVKVMLRVESVLKSNCMEGSKLVAGHQNRHNIIQSVNVMDAPDIVKWVNKNELLLTTGFAIINNKEYVTELVKGLKEKGCAALGIKAKRYFDSIPEYIIEIANEYGLPLIELSYSVNFGQITSEIMEKCITSSEKDSNIKALIDEGLDQQDLDNVIRMLSQILDSDISLESIYLDAPIAFHKGKPSEELMKVIRENDFMQQIHDTSLNNSLVNKKSFTLDLGRNDLNFKNRMVVPVRLRKENIGFITLWNKENELLVYDDNKAIEYGLSLIIFLLKEQRTQMISNKKLKTIIVHDLLNYKAEMAEKIHNETNYAGIVLRGNYVVVTLCLPHSISEKSEIEELKFNNMIFTLDRHLYKYLGSEPLIGQYNGNLLVILYNINGEKMKYVDKIVDLIQKHDNIRILTDAYIMGISSDCSTLEQIRKAYQESLSAAEFARERGKKVMKYQQLGIVGAFLKPDQGMGLSDLVESTIKPIIQTSECDGKLLDTLQAYFRNNESLIETSKELFLHRNSLKYRLDMVEKLTGLSLCRTEDKLRLYLGVKAYAILHTDSEFAGERCPEERLSME